MLEAVLRFVTLGSVLVGCLAVYTAVRNNGRQLGVQIFLNYSERVQSLRYGLSEEASRDRALQDIFYVMLEFYTLHRRGYVARDIWNIWQADITRFLASELVCQKWARIEALFAAHVDFLDWLRRRRVQDSQLL